VKSSTYASLVTILFVTHRNAISKSIESAIRATDTLCMKLGIENDLSHMTKHRVVKELVQSKVLVSIPTKKQKKLHLAQRVSDLFL